MTDGCSCGCGHNTGVIAIGAPVRITAEQTVEDVKQRPGALETLKRLGINHCCGAHMSLRQAAAAAGVELNVLLAALNGPSATR